MTGINGASGNSRRGGEGRRDHIEVFREFVDHLNRVAGCGERANAKPDAGRGSRQRSQA